MASKGKRDPNFPMQGRTGGMGGQYGSKSTNLTAKQLKAAGAAKAAKKRTVSISQTRREGSRTLGPGGKPLTGTVTLSDGSKAVYKNGRRVQAADMRKPKSRPSSGSGGSGSSGGGGGGGRTGPRVGEIRKGRAGNKYNKWDGKKWVPVAAARTAGADGRADALGKSKPKGNLASVGYTDGAGRARTPGATQWSKPPDPPRQNPAPPKSKPKKTGIRLSEAGYSNGRASKSPTRWS